MNAPLFAGFEGAKLHWNGHDTLLSTGHTPEALMGAHYQEALAQGAVGFRDVMPERFDVTGRWLRARVSVPRGTPIVWSMIHFDQPCNPLKHAQSCARTAGPYDRFIAVCEPSVGYAVAKRSREQATLLSAAMMGAALATRGSVRFWTCDPVHSLNPDVWRATDFLVDLFDKAIEVVGINHHPMHGGAPIRDILRAAADRYPDHRIGLTETSWHDGHPVAESVFPTIRSRREWWDHVQNEIAASGVDLACVTWMPWKSMSWEPDQHWPNGWPMTHEENEHD